MAGLIQNEDVKSAAELVSGGGTNAQLINDTKIYVTANSANEALFDAIGDGKIVPNNSVTLAKLATIATQTFLGRTTAGTGNVESLTATQATAILNVVVGDSGSGGTKGLVPAPGAGDAAAGKFLKADGTFQTVAAAATVQAKSANFTAATNFIYVVDTSSGAVTATLPSAVSGAQIYIKDAKGTAATNNITIAPAGGAKIDTSTSSLLMTTNFQSEFLISDGTDWFRI